MTYIDRGKCVSSSSQRVAVMSRKLSAHIASHRSAADRRESRREFEIDDDSFDTPVHWRKLTLKTKGMTDRWFGILIALPQYRAVMGRQER